ncbi:O-acetylhomoserine aminocarboxypropyltransferase/cysteine synthase [Deinococcus detaillensis]|uniref:O-acetylhomoserine aminocarboxypropyltransferase/cysteine synthase n=1 Tax=Deinococcus detaillensis TaxID=2592048 RepID=A0A553V372_9DEIO|nr:aminotransferase class I/II-fold pyridoxal phosphate-dependent enzyme [Deinococcus detaillensis]TSA86834.1 O-acetylhomoserine aminocarboxypropyltransferase/cysteine synthase [Deinococcus detaillensis]
MTPPNYDAALDLPPELAADLSYDTLAVHTGIGRGTGVGVGIPIQQMAAFQFDSLEAAAGEFQTNTGSSYSRIQNPTVKALERRITALEAGQETVCLSSGQAASFTAFLSACRAGDHIVATSSLFGGSVAMLSNVLPLMGITASLVPNTPDAVKAAMQTNTKLIWAETIGNPAADVADLSALAKIAHAQGALLGVDNTWGGVGLLCCPLDFGADMVTHSLTKWAGGHGSVLGGSVTVGERHSLTRNAIYTDGEPSLLEARGAGALAWRQRWFGASQLGMILPPQSAYAIAQGLETLSLRLTRECETALALAEFLEGHVGVGRVNYPGLEGSEFHALGQQYLSGGFGAVMSFEVARPEEFLSRLKVIRMAPNLGDTRTLVVHPWTTTHGKMPEAARRAAGVTPQSIRMSVGVESLADLQADLERALS